MPKAQGQILCDRLMEEEKAQAWCQLEMDGGITTGLLLALLSRVFRIHGFSQPQFENIPKKGYLTIAQNNQNVAFHP